MAEGFPPVPPHEPAAQRHGYEPAAPPVQSHAVPQVRAAAPAGSASDPKKSKARIWWLIGILVLLVLLIGSCAAPLIFFATDSSKVSVGSGDAVGVIHLDGVIAGTGDSLSGVITPEHFLSLLEQAEQDDRVKAILLRVDSPGGTVAASEEISHYVAECPKPVVVSVGDVGASGAYMVSSQADEIWANAGSSVGSIGVISQIPNVSGLMDKVGVEFQVITAGKNKDTGSPYRQLTEDERALIQGEVDDAYELFIDLVATGRQLSEPQVEDLATGWAWNGETAKDMGLVDEIGTYRDALDAAAERGGIEGDYDIVTFDSDPFESLFGPLFSITSRFGGLDALTTRESLIRESLPR